MPERRVASMLPPVQYTDRPKAERLRKMCIITYRAITAINITGKPYIVVLPSHCTDRGKLFIIWLLVTTSARLHSTFFMSRVDKKGERCSLVNSRPFTQPTAAPASIHMSSISRSFAMLALLSVP